MIQRFIELYLRKLDPLGIKVKKNRCLDWKTTGNKANTDDEWLM